MPPLLKVVVLQPDVRTRFSSQVWATSEAVEVEVGQHWKTGHELTKVHSLLIPSTAIHSVPLKFTLLKDPAGQVSLDDERVVKQTFESIRGSHCRIICTGTPIKTKSVDQAIDEAVVVEKVTVHIRPVKRMALNVPSFHLSVHVFDDMSDRCHQHTSAINLLT